MTGARHALSFRRDLEFVQASELTKRMGAGPELWPRAIVKELVDNALDACEEAGAAPQITVRIEACAIEVRDNGPGITPDVVALLCDRSLRTSSREAYPAPDRGAQGNALQTIMCLPFGLGHERAELIIMSRGVRHAITLVVDRIVGQIAIDRNETEIAHSEGAVVRIAYPLDQVPFVALADLRNLILDFGMLNPHAGFELVDATDLENGDGDGPAVPPLAPLRPRGEVTKWTAGMPVPPHWYALERFEHRVLLELRRDPNITVSQFLAGFRGLTSGPMRSKVASEAGLSGARLSALVDDTALDTERCARLLDAMQAASRPPKPAALGAVGKNSVEAAVARHVAETAGAGFTYRIDDLGDGAAIARWEVAFAYMPGARGRVVYAGHNFSPVVDDDAFIESLGLPWELGEREPVFLFLHRISPTRTFTDYGKSRLGLGSEERRHVRQAIERVAGKWMKQRRQEERRQTAEHNRLDRLRDRAERAERSTIRDAAFAVMVDAYNAASSDGRRTVTARQIMYKARPPILEMTGRDKLEDAYFVTRLLPEFLQAHPDLTRAWRIYFAPRGEFTEPYTRRAFKVGTKDVGSYLADARANGAYLTTREEIAPWTADTSGPTDRYAGIVAIEKGGIAETLVQEGIHNQLDVAVLNLQGQPVEAALALIDHLQVPVLVLHDFDRAGLTIGANVNGTWRHRHENEFLIRSIGLRLDHVRDWGLEREPIDAKNLKSVSDDRLRECGATPDELEFLRRHRVELDAASTEQLITLVEQGFADLGIGKVVPDTERLVEAYRAAGINAEIAAAYRRVVEEAERRWNIVAPPPDLEERIRAALEERPHVSWDQVLREIVEGTVE